LRSFLGEVSALNKLTSRLLELYRAEIKPLHGKALAELPDHIREMVLGGLKSDGSYGENAYAKFVYDFLGLRLEDPQRYITLARLWKVPDVKVAVEEGASQYNFVKFVHYLNKLTEFILEKARDAGIEPPQVSEAPSDVYSLVSDLVEKAANLMLGVNKVTTFIFSIRKTTTHYLKAAYGDIPRGLLELLGLSKLLEAYGLELWGFGDYFTKAIVVKIGRPDYRFRTVINGVPLYKSSTDDWGISDISRVASIRPETLGGAISSLNATIMTAFKSRDVSIHKWYPDATRLVNEYLQEARKSLEDAGWKFPEYLKCDVISDEYIGEERYKRATAIPVVPMEGIIRGFGDYYVLKYDETLIVKDIEYSYRIWHSLPFGPATFMGVGRGSSRVSKYFAVSELFRDLMPAIFLGLVDVALQYAAFYDSVSHEDLLNAKYDRGLLVFSWI